jgi:hypothetical protein
MMANVLGQGRCAALSRSVPCTAVLGFTEDGVIRGRLMRRGYFAGNFFRAFVFAGGAEAVSDFGVSTVFGAA